MKKIFCLILALAAFASSKINAQEFFDTSGPSSRFTLSARMGINTSNRTFPSGHYNLWNKNSWGLGFNIGVLANLNFKEYFSLQPGIFYESRSGDFSYVTDYLDGLNQNQTHYEMGHLRSYYVTIPLMAIVKFNLASNIKWSAELGPYFQYCFSESGQNNVTVLYRLPQSNLYATYTAQHRSMDAGLKIGTGLQVYKHYYVGVHYLAGFCSAWKLPEGGKNKSWQFTLGYDF